MGRERAASRPRHPVPMGPSETDMPSERMFIVRHELLDATTLSRERFWLGDLDAASSESAASLEVRVDADTARLGPLMLADGTSAAHERRLVGAALRELVGRGVQRIEIGDSTGSVVSDELEHLGFVRFEHTSTWEAGVAG